MKWNSTELWDKDKQWLHATLDANGDVVMSGETGGKRPAEGPPANEPTPKKAAEATNQIVVHKPSRNWMNEAAQAGGDEAPTEAARLQGTGPGGNQVSKETPISPYPSLSYGLQETHTTIVPFNFWFSSVGMDKTRANVMEIRMTSPIDIIKSQLSTNSGTSAWTQGNFNVPFNNAAAFNTSTGTFPRTIATGADATEQPFWYRYWSQVYEYFTVLGCEYHITIRNISSPGGNEIIVGQQFDVYSDTASTTGNIWPQSTPLAEAFAHRHIKWTIVNSETTGEESMKNNGSAVIIR